jgi:ribonuclease HI
LADFVVDWTSPTHNPGDEILTPWVVQCDGAWCHKGVGISAVVTSPTGVVIRYASRLIFANDEHFTNNTMEYEALLLALRKMKDLGQQNLHHQDRLQSHSAAYRKRERSKKSYFDEIP